MHLETIYMYESEESQLIGYIYSLNTRNLEHNTNSWHIKLEQMPANGHRSDHSADNAANLTCNS